MGALRPERLPRDLGSAAATGPSSPNERSFHEPTHEPPFREPWSRYLRRLVLGAAYALQPQRIALLPRLWWMTFAYYLSPGDVRDHLPARPTYYTNWGLAGISDDLGVPALLHNYAQGLFPVCHIGPMKWWCPSLRAVQDPRNARVGRTVRRLIRRHSFTVTMDTDFVGVMEACAQPRPGKTPLTWITPKVMRAFYAAYRAGYAHSVEVWDRHGRLVGGLFGLAIGQVYFGESKFSRSSHASKVAVAYLHRHLAAWGYRLYDAKWMTPHLAETGFVAMPRDDFLSLLPWYTSEEGHVGRWSVDPALDPADWSKGWDVASPTPPGAAPHAA